MAPHFSEHFQNLSLSVGSHLCLLLVHLAAGVAQVPGQAEVGDLAAAVVVDQDVASGQVPMDDLVRIDIFKLPFSHILLLYLCLPHRWRC